MLPGIAKTSRPCVPASRAVISEPLWRAASTTSVPSDRPLMSLLRRGKFPRSGGGGNLREKRRKSLAVTADQGHRGALEPAAVLLEEAPLGAREPRGGGGGEAA